jgi:hypothetical protein
MQIFQVAELKGPDTRAQTATPIRHLASLEHWREEFNSDGI